MAQTRWRRRVGGDALAYCMAVLLTPLVTGIAIDLYFVQLDL